MAIEMEGGHAWRAVLSFGEYKEVETLDLEIAVWHNFVVNGLVTHNSTTLATKGILRSLLRPYTNTLFVTPLYEQVRKFSNNYVKVLIETSHIKHLLADRGGSDANVLQRGFSNGSNMFFAYAFLDADRTRGIPSTQISLDETQDIDPDLLEVILASSTASKFKTIDYSGTPKTSANLLHYQWEKSSKGEWVTKCDRCNHYNVACLDLDLEKMIGKYGPICAKCGGPINTTTGAWYHFDRAKTETFPGYHIGQPILTLHSNSPNKWAELVTARETWSRHKYLNEILGETCDVGSKLVTLDDWRAACANGLPYKHNDLTAASTQCRNYNIVCMGVDWSVGAGGTSTVRKGRLVTSEGTASYTAVAVVGFNGDLSKPELIYANVLPPRMNYREEVSAIMDVYRSCRCINFAHDAGGAGIMREQVLVEAGLPIEQSMSCIYKATNPATPIVVPNKMSEVRNRWTYMVDKTRSLSMTCAILQQGKLKGPIFDEGMELLARHFLALSESRTSTRSSNDTFYIAQDPGKPSDFAHALNLALCGAWHFHRAYPLMTSLFGIPAPMSETGGTPFTVYDEEL